MRKLIRLALVGAFLVTAMMASQSTANANHLGCEIWYEGGFCYYSCPGHGDGHC